MVKLNAVMVDQDEKILKIINYDEHYYSQDLDEEEVDDDFEAQDFLESEESMIDEFNYIEEDRRLPHHLRLPCEKKIEHMITGSKTIPFIDILNIQLKKDKIEYVEIEYRDWYHGYSHESMPLTTLKVRNLYYNLIDLWSLSLSHIQSLVSSQKRIRDGMHHEKHISHYETFMGQRKFVKTKSDLVNYRMRNSFFKSLGLPMEEVILERYGCIFRSTSLAKEIIPYTSGLMTITEHFIIFQNTSRDITIVIPYCEIQSLSPEDRDILNIFNIEIVWGIRYHFEIIKPVDLFPVILKQYQSAISQLGKTLPHHPLKVLLSDKIEAFNLRESTHPMSKIMSTLLEDTHPVSNNTKLPGLEIQEDPESLKTITTYFENYGFSIGMTRVMPELIKVVGKGLPYGLRGILWVYLSGASHLMLSYPVNYYRDLKDMKKEENTVAKQEIERDLHRSLPEHYYYKTEEGRSALRNVLTAFSWHNPSIGYCQSMNVIVAFLLLYMDEEQAFFTIIRITEMVPDFYTREMIGSLVDSKVFGHLVQKHFPKLHAHFEHIEMALSIVVLPWFLCIFVGYLPWPIIPRILDCFFLIGPSFLFQVSLAIFETHHDLLLHAVDSIDVADIIRSHAHKYNADVLIGMALNKYKIEHDQTEILKRYYMRQAIEELEYSNFKQDQIKLEAENVLFDDIFVLSCFAEYRREIYIRRPRELLSLRSFRYVLFKHLVWMRNLDRSEEMLQLFLSGFYKYLKKDVTIEGLSFIEYMRGLYILHEGALGDLIHIVYVAFQKDKSQVFDYDMFAEIYRMINAIAYHRGIILSKKSENTYFEDLDDEAWSIVSDEDEQLRKWFKKMEKVDDSSQKSEKIVPECKMKEIIVTMNHIKKESKKKL